jgi:glucosamine--fructose-6-phosphate aminotransferase (isomerizing)
MVRRALKLNDQIKQLAADLKEEQSCLMFGRGRNYATAMEAALKVKEVSYMHSEGINAGEMKHGPLALVDDKLPIVVISTMDSMHSKMAGVIQQVGSRKAGRQPAGAGSGRRQRGAPTACCWAAVGWGV